MRAKRKEKFANCPKKRDRILRFFHREDVIMQFSVYCGQFKRVILKHCLLHETGEYY